MRYVGALEKRRTSAHSTSYFGDPPRGPLTPVYLSRLRMHAYTVICLIGSIRADTAAAVALADRWTRTTRTEAAMSAAKAILIFSSLRPGRRKRRRRRWEEGRWSDRHREQSWRDFLLPTLPEVTFPSRFVHDGPSCTGRLIVLTSLSDTFICCYRCSVVRPSGSGGT